MRPCIFVIGTRAQLVKMAPVIRAASDSALQHTIWLSGQHSESMDDLFRDFSLESAVTGSRKARERSTVLGLLTWLPAALWSCYRYVRRIAAQAAMRPLVVVHGDTLSTLVSAVAGRLAGGDIVHLESGLTSGRLLDPFPEEMLRRLTFRLAAFAVCPGEEPARQMQRYRCRDIANTGENTVLDCVRYALGADRRNHPVPPPGDYFVVSIHRFQNIYVRSRLSLIVREVMALAGVGKVYFVLHPPTRKRLGRAGLLDPLRNSAGVVLQARMPYTQFVSLLANSRGVLTDGGSNQEELSYLGVPTILYRDRSERTEGLGRNIVFRESIGGDLRDFVASGGLEKLRSPTLVTSDVHPSRTAVDALVRWSVAEKPA